MDSVEKGKRNYVVTNVTDSLEDLKRSVRSSKTDISSIIERSEDTELELEKIMSELTRIELSISYIREHAKRYLLK